MRVKFSYFFFKTWNNVRYKVHYRTLSVQRQMIPKGNKVNTHVSVTA